MIAKIGQTNYNLIFVNQGDKKNIKRLYNSTGFNVAICDFAAKDILFFNPYFKAAELGEKKRVLIHEFVHALIFQHLYNERLVDSIAKEMINVFDTIEKLEVLK